MSLLETARVYHADVERAQQEIVEELRNEPVTQKMRVLHEHFIKQRLDRIQGRGTELLQIYESEDFKNIGNENPSRVVASFYTRLAELREYHRKFQQSVALEMEQEGKVELVQEEDLPVAFTAEECYGKYLDLHDLFLEYTNLPFNFDNPAIPAERDAAGGVTALALAAARHQAIDYQTFLQRLGQFHTIARKHKTEEYRRFLERLRAYLESFLRRTQPLSRVDDMVRETETQFRAAWGRRELMGWADLEEAPVDASGNVTSKKALRRLHFFEKVALLETQIQRFLEVLGDVLQNTINNLERKHNRTREEIEAELQREEEATRRALQRKKDKEEEEEPEDEDLPKIRDNPLDLPLGWDGKPIPYWLYKLHGLGIEYKCEICSNYSYFGPRAFERHFQDWRHAHGMKCLRIPNTRHFHQVTRIHDAMALWDKIRYETSTKGWKPDLEQEYEDHEGHVFNKKTYDDMKRQGLL
nr:Splicing factor 3A subunit 3 [Euglena gracilis]